ncbi:hypothetical protein [Schwartzia succinivorans]|jgi:hypothetical protein|uniref:Uncharacterized protein n=1 Tax=Schwartzia succinivorans DSM 10502 TaxID=1123243 RepID=A0A1M4ZHM7_9FIRM|nr:hypothetical protein [Schwartzia succinivorans]MBQ3863183.1 hypothetical protein [Schwartzia sp. (in: firmicutes)]MBQ5413590.1 hypothetical protein [Schwartzia sp. (in: firmicutes)]SHF17539.1 hypothetical protein SAMN02745190_02021 [Schwartzia succinivorans DSM 10502]
MIPLQAIAIAGVVLLIFIAHRLCPDRKIFALFTVIILTASGALFFYSAKPVEPEPMSAEERAELAVQQELVADWFASYQFYLERLDRNWQKYHRILSDFEADVISIQIARSRLIHLEESSRALAVEVEKLEPPNGLHAENYDLAASIFIKVRSYAQAQHHAISATAQAADPETMPTDIQEEQSRRLRETMIRESPAGLFTGAELAALRDHVSIKE